MTKQARSLATTSILELKPIARQTLAQVAMERLLDLIQIGSVQPGDLLPSQHELARQLGVSRPVLREAMQGLSAAGMIDIRPGSGCYVADPQAQTDPESLFEVVTHEIALETLEARFVVEVELAALASARATEVDKRTMESSLARLKRAASRDQPTAAITSDFHRALIKAGHNTVLEKMSRLLSRPRLAQGVRVESTLPDIAAGEYQSHRVLFDEIFTGDAERARAAMRRHLEIAHGWEVRIASLRSELRE